MAKNLTDLTARTATADSDLIHVNSGGTDYKEQKVDFLHGDLGRLFDNTTSLIGQAEALPTDGTYYGRILGYGHQSETGLPINAHCYVKVQKSSSSTIFIEVWSTADAEGSHYSITKTSNVWGSWVKIPTRAEITSLNNSLTQCLTTTPGIITSGRDLNDYKSNGLYIIQSGVTNSPSSWCALLVIGTPTTYGVHQVAFSFSAFYVRSYTGSPMAWTNWRSLTFS